MSVKRYWVWRDQLGEVPQPYSASAEVVLASDHEREVAGLRADIDILKAQLDGWFKAEREFYGIEKQPGDTDRQSAVKRILADRDALQKRCGELEKALADAIDCVDSWGAYASVYFKDKHDLDGDLSRLRAALRPADGEGEK